MTDGEAYAHGEEWLKLGWVWALGQVILMRSEVDGAHWYTQALVVEVSNGRPSGAVHMDGRGFGIEGDVVPDLRDPGTRGHGEDQTRAAMRDDRGYVRPWGDGFGWASSTNMSWPVRRTRSAAMIAARKALRA